MDQVFAAHHPREGVALAQQLAEGCERSREVAFGLAELITNGIEHGNLGLGFALKCQLLSAGRFESELARRLADRPDSRVLVTVTRLPDLVRFVVEDQGGGFDWRPWLRPDPARASAPNGRGIALARDTCFASLNYRAPGNVVEALAVRAA
ncbi:MAG: ATP-binding protein [Rhodocyclaceae bacterium]|nr:ATP-binding protein [Rhodocyclaceae bacterium]